ncbi:hypothetical protein ADK75_03920 [Streptomyces virginiae]|uniref:Uncharacterized protein n=1 Tax=Streptomyces virginiae TaxID=1961 RepID=A0A0L8N4N0_STRVG|nr:hypothetical protein ADK75_03920 [Streptomyces virginiae]
MICRFLVGHALAHQMSDDGFTLIEREEATGGFLRRAKATFFKIFCATFNEGGGAERRIDLMSGTQV